MVDDKKNFSLNNSVSHLPRVSKKIAEKLENLGILTLQDLLLHLPFRYQDKTKIVAINKLSLAEEALVEGVIENVNIRYAGRRFLSCVIYDGSGWLTIRFFHFSKAQAAKLVKGKILRCYGKVKKGQGMLEILHPEYSCFEPSYAPDIETKLTPIYPLTAGLQQRTLRRLCSFVLDLLRIKNCTMLLELVPADILATVGFSKNMISALHYVHLPPTDADLQLLQEMKHPAQQRLIFEELLSQYLWLQDMRKQVVAFNAPSLIDKKNLCTKFIQQLDFILTSDQIKVLKEIAHDLKRNTPMLRLLQGDVGSGKTVIAACAALHAFASEYQVAFMVPTELLAEQHFALFTQWFECLNDENLDISILLMTAKSTKVERDANLQILRSKKNVIAIGTHALFQKDIVFLNMGLVIIDEQHRFGVHQRSSLLEKGMVNDCMPHQLIMTATPIPRTLSMMMHAYLDVSTINVMPKNRHVINTVVMANDQRDAIISKIEDVCNCGKQVYWVCTLIEKSLVLQCQTATEIFNQLQKKLKNINIGLVHGRMKSADRGVVMRAFKENKIQLLVATTVIEVGVDVPNANLMIIENAERLGLSQLHQLRGRIGRGNIKSDCIIMYQKPLSDLARNRLDILRNVSDGFKIADHDLQLRGCGDLVGTRQTGLPELSIAEPFRDANLLNGVHKVAGMLQKKHPRNIDLLIARWFGNKLRYRNV